MNKMQEACQIETIKQQCYALQNKGYDIYLNFTKNGLETSAKVVIRKNLKAWHFADPDLNVIISQICTLHANFNKKEERIRKIINLTGLKYGKVQNG